ncbi:DEAD/DEAH box helicase [Phenylobacterium sp. 58.2.17]|uniref:DEAD/DEAH box helicase n=1 Tax=Phenylobacterium sp. 58.2.17 TaxID=2969306 RepID=UPI002264D770|nr:DEAD/DEAH box helicase [Phenylobacterium sp. 58.2.17]MCX7585547.1 DEAD/DEAH box helicase [Phenylobacterium sp. 58.2.17]
MAFPNIHPALARALASQGYEEPTPVQAAVLTEEAEGRDLLVSAQTGSGKTVAFGLAAGPTLLGEEQWFGQAGPPLALAIAPTRELAMQVARELSWLYGQSGAKVETCVGGMDPRREQRALAAGCHILVGTPGRLKDHLERGNLDLGALRVLVLDEADEMLDMGFREDLEEILDSSPVDRRTLLFSATIAKDIAALAKRYQRNALRIDTVRRDEPHGDIEYRAVRVAPNEVELAVVNVLRFFEAPGALVFCNTRDGVRHMHAALRERGFQVVGLSGELGQRERSEALQALRDGHARVCVATDVAARGLDLPDLGLVIHADLPINKPALLHRSGRTGRAGKKGTSVLLVPYTRRRKAEQLLASAGVDVHWQGPPTADEIKAKDQARMLEDPILTEEPAEEDLALARLVLETRSAEQVAAALMRLYRQRLPAPEELYDDARMRDAQVRDRERPQRGDRWEPSDRDDGPVGRPPRLAPEDVSWFRITVGRDKNADPKWLIPMICRLGHITKKDIGSIRIFDRETKFEISKEAEAKFASAVKPTVNDEIKIEASGPPGGPTSPPRGGPHRKGPPSGDRPFRKGPPGEGKPPFRKGAAGEDRPPFRKGPPHEGGKPAFKGPPGSPGPKGGKPPWKKKGNEQRK